MITEKPILDTISSTQFNAIHHKNRQAHSNVLSKTALKALKQSVLERTSIFSKNMDINTGLGNISQFIKSP